MSYTLVFAGVVALALTFGLVLRARKTPLSLRGEDYSFVEQARPGLISVPLKGSVLGPQDMVPSAKSPELGRRLAIETLDDLESPDSGFHEVHPAPTTSEARAVQDLLKEMEVAEQREPEPVSTIVQFLDTGMKQVPAMSSCASIDTSVPEYTFDEDNGGLAHKMNAPRLISVY